MLTIFHSYIIYRHVICVLSAVQNVSRQGTYLFVELPQNIWKGRTGSVPPGARMIMPPGQESNFEVMYSPAEVAQARQTMRREGAEQ